MKDMATGKSKGYGFVSFFNKWVSSHHPVDSETSLDVALFMKPLKFRFCNRLLCGSFVVRLLLITRLFLRFRMQRTPFSTWGGSGWVADRFELTGPQGSLPPQRPPMKVR